jgi:muramidase (phage lysozyme)
MTPEQIVNGLSAWDANKFTIVQHESEWYDKAESKSIFDLLLQMYKEHDIDLPAKLEHEKERVNKLIWMQDESKIGFGKHVWSWWPINITSVKKTWADTTFAQLLGKVESNNDYSAYNRTKGGLKAFFNTNLTNSTIKEIQERQKLREIFAVGRFQLIPTTLSSAVKILHLSDNLKFDKIVQDKIFNEYLIKVKRPEIISYLEGNGTVEDAIYSWAKEFASAGVQAGRKISRNRIASGGESYYAGDGLNKAHLTPSQMINALKESKNEI